MAHLVFESGVPGGQIAIANEVENWPGDKTVKGSDLASRMFEQVFGHAHFVLLARRDRDVERPAFEVDDSVDFG